MQISCMRLILKINNPTLPVAKKQNRNNILSWKFITGKYLDAESWNTHVDVINNTADLSYEVWATQGFGRIFNI